MKNQKNQILQLSIVGLTSYIKQFLGGPSEVDTEALKLENEELKARVEALQAQIDQLNSHHVNHF